MIEIFSYTIATLVALGAVGAIVLYFVAQKFKVYEDPRIDISESMLPGANCGGCGFAGCRGLATALVEQDDITALYCPVGGGDTMTAVANYLGKAAPEKEPTVAVVRCAGSYCTRPRTNTFDGELSCAVVASLYGGETGCTWGCLGKGDCTLVCNFGAIHMNAETSLPEVDADKCTACGKCVTACPKMVIELRKKGPKGRRIYVSCISKDKGAITRKACTVGCIGCGKCVKICPFEAITLDQGLAYINPAVCRLCRKCVAECPTGAIVEVGFPPKAAPVAKVAEKAADQATTEKAVAKTPEQTSAEKTAEETTAAQAAPASSALAAIVAATAASAAVAESTPSEQPQNLEESTKDA